MFLTLKVVRRPTPLVPSSSLGVEFWQTTTPSTSFAQLPPLLPRVAYSPRPREGCARATRRRATCARPHRRPAPRRWSPPPLLPKRGVVALKTLPSPPEEIGSAIRARADGSRHSAAVAAPGQESHRADQATRRSISHWIEFWPTTRPVDEISRDQRLLRDLKARRSMSIQQFAIDSV